MRLKQNLPNIEISNTEKNSQVWKILLWKRPYCLWRRATADSNFCTSYTLLLSVCYHMAFIDETCWKCIAKLARLFGENPLSFWNTFYLFLHLPTGSSTPPNPLDFLHRSTPSIFLAPVELLFTLLLSTLNILQCIAILYWAKETSRSVKLFANCVVLVEFHR